MLAEIDWESHRPAVFGAAYRILGTVAEAEDVAQEVWLRAAAADLSKVRDLRAWLAALAARTSYNVLNGSRPARVLCRALAARTAADRAGCRRPGAGGRVGEHRDAGGHGDAHSRRACRARAA
ncbi:sigma factor [Streptomyces sp. NPDC020192]|uniref:sigma factor n=1 Tax=Streptomyces sp. NPDC020192 TaxID=3365066 RepID=UPI00379C751E